MDTPVAPRLRASRGQSPGPAAAAPEAPATEKSAAGTAKPAGPAASSPGFEQFFREQYPVVVRIAYAVVGEDQAAQDVAQDVFVAALSRFGDPGDPGSPGHREHASAWVRVAAAHTALNAIRGERRRARRQVRSGVAVAAAGPEEQVLDREARAEVRRALARLPRRAATVLVLRHNGLSYAEVAEAMDVTTGQVGTMLRRAESALRKELTNASRA